MAITDALFTVPQYRAWVKKESASDDLQIANDAVMSSRWLEDRCGQFFTKDDEPVVRLFRAKYSDLLDLDYEGKCPGIATSVGLMIDGVAYSADDYDLEPLQAAMGPVVRPYNTIRVKRGSSKSFTSGEVVPVTAAFGWPVIPLVAKEVAMEWCAIWRGESIRTTARVNEMDQVETVSPYHLGQMNKLIDVCRSRVTF